MVFRCSICGRKLDKPGPYCTGNVPCNKKPLPRCLNCNALWRKDRNSAKYAQCPSGKAQGGAHFWVFRGETKQIDPDELAKVV